MKVLFVSSNFPRWPGDSRGPSMIQQSRALQELGAKVIVITMHGPGIKAREVMEGVEVIRPRYMVPEKLEFLQNVGGGLPAVWEKQPLARLIFIPFMLSNMWAIMRYGRSCDVIHTHWTLSAAAAWLTAWYHHRPNVVTLHGSEVYQFGRTRLGGMINKFFLSRCDRVLAITEDLANAVVAQGVPRALIEIVPDGVNIERFQPPAGTHEPLILFCGSLIPRKGVNYLLEAMVSVLARFPHYRLAVVGQGPESANLVRQAETLGIASRVDFIGPQSQEQVRIWMQRAKILAVPSLDEALGIVALEAQASATPVVASRVGGIPEITSPETAILVPPADPPALAEAICRLLDEEVWSAYSQKCRPWAEQKFLSWDKVAQDLLRIFAQVIEERASKRNRAKQ
jgi:glycosyltransferase involved in cell wall biosynthesis